MSGRLKWVSDICTQIFLNVNGQVRAGDALVCMVSSVAIYFSGFDIICLPSLVGFWVQIFINVPWYFSVLYSMFSPFLTQRTKSKFVISKEGNVAETLYK